MSYFKAKKYFFKQKHLNCIFINYMKDLKIGRGPRKVARGP